MLAVGRRGRGVLLHAGQHVEVHRGAGRQKSVRNRLTMIPMMIRMMMTMKMTMVMTMVMTMIMMMTIAQVLFGAHHLYSIVRGQHPLLDIRRFNAGNCQVQCTYIDV